MGPFGAKAAPKPPVEKHSSPHPKLLFINAPEKPKEFAMLTI